MGEVNPVRGVDATVCLGGPRKLRYQCINLLTTNQPTELAKILCFYSDDSELLTKSLSSSLLIGWLVNSVSVLRHAYPSPTELCLSRLLPC